MVCLNINEDHYYLRTFPFVVSWHSRCRNLRLLCKLRKWKTCAKTARKHPNQANLFTNHLRSTLNESNGCFAFLCVHIPALLPLLSRPPWTCRSVTICQNTILTSTTTYTQIYRSTEAQVVLISSWNWQTCNEFPNRSYSRNCGIKRPGRFTCFCMMKSQYNLDISASFSC